MRKTMSIEGLECQLCCDRVTDALNELQGVQAVTDLLRGIASITTDGSVSDEQLKQAVVNAGYQVAGLKDS